MINTLKYFVEGGLFSSTCQLLDKLGVKYEKVSEQPIDIAQEFKESQSKELPEYATSILKYVDKTYFVGHVNDEKYNADDERYKGLFVFAAEYKENARPTRSDMSNLTRLFNRISADKPVVAILRQGHLISIATCERTNYQQQWRKSQGERVGKVSILRGIDCSNPHRGHLDILESLVADRKIKTFDDLYEHWQKIFSTELLTQQFYNELFEWYKWVAIDKGVKISFPKGLSKEEDPGDGIHITRLATRMMFVWFIKQMNLVPNELFDEGSLKKILCKFVPQSETDGCYYNAILQNLFFATLNQEIKNRRFAIYKDDENNEEKENNYGDKCYYRDNKAKSWFSISKEEVLSIFHKVPYLNGGLFECLDKTDKKHGGKVIYYDGFSREPNRQAHIPNCVFFDKEKGLLSIFNRYHFTVEENTPTEQLVALDPELLGKVF